MPKDDLNKLVSLVQLESLDNEKWKELPNTNGKNFVSDQGRVLSLRNNKGRVLTPFICNNSEGIGYRYVSIRYKGEVEFRDMKIARLVADAFIDNPEGKRIVHHKDGNRLNDKAENLEWVTDKEHAQRHKELEAIKSNE